MIVLKDCCFKAAVFSQSANREDQFPDWDCSGILAVMNEAAQWITRLFIKDHTPLERRETITALCFLWFINVFSFSPLLDSSLSTVVAGRKGVTWLAGHNIFSQVFAMFISVNIPWTFFLLLGCIGLMHRIIQKKTKLIASLLFGILLFLFYRSLTVLPVLFIGEENLFTSNQEILDLLAPSQMKLKGMALYSLAAGLLIISAAIIRSGTGSAGNIRDFFIQRYILLSFASFFIALVFYIFRIETESPSFSYWIIAIIAIALLQLILIIHRLYNSPFSLWFLPLFLLPALLAGTGSLLGYFTDELYLASVGNILTGIGINAIGPLFLAIATAPPVKHLPKQPLPA